MTNLKTSKEPFIITQNGEEKVVIQDIVSYEETQKTLALLKILALGQQQVEAGQINDMTSVVQRLKNKKK